MYCFTINACEWVKLLISSHSFSFCEVLSATCYHQCNVLWYWVIIDDITWDVRVSFVACSPAFRLVSFSEKDNNSLFFSWQEFKSFSSSDWSVCCFFKDSSSSAKCCFDLKRWICKGLYCSTWHLLTSPVLFAPVQYLQSSYLIFPSPLSADYSHNVSAPRPGLDQAEISP